MPEEPAAEALPEEVQILHLSDVHAGRGFVTNRWNELLNLLETELKPRLVIVSGDLVNSPTRNEFKRAKQHIDELREKCAWGTEFVVLPGNHDTRIFGIVSVSRLRLYTAIILGLLLLATWIWWPTRVALWWNGPTLPLWPLAVVCDVIATAVLIVSFAYYVEFQAWFPRPKPIIQFKELGVDLLIFDSASDIGAHWAEGVVTEPNFVEVRKLTGETPSRNFRIAVLHHHALPIPYEHGAEPMMVLRNAGAFLSEISRLKVALVLHGHRHRFSFSRVTVNADEKQPFQIGVLSTGSVSSGDRDAHRLGHNFSVVAVNRWGNARITRYQSQSGSTFRAHDPFLARSIGLATREYFLQNALVNGCRCESMRINIRITTDGDAHRTIEYRDFAVTRETDRLPGTLRANVTTGQIERVRLGRHNFPAGFSPSLRGTRTSNSWSGELTFGANLKPVHLPITFSWHRDLVNAFAMSAEQYRLMYKSTEASPVESTIFKLRHVPAAELLLTIEFPDGFMPDGTPALGVLKGKNPEFELTHEYQSGLAYDRRHNLVFARIPYPPLDFDYLLEWRLRRTSRTQLNLPPSEQGKLREAVKKMLRLASTDPGKSPLNRLCAGVKLAAADALKLGKDEEFRCSITAFDDAINALRVVAADFDPADHRWNMRLNYGDGIAGRAYKMGRGRVFVKQRAIAEGTPFYYVTADGNPVSDDGHEIPDEVVVSLPLYSSGSGSSVLAILSLNSESAGSKLADLDERRLDDTRDFVESVGNGCLAILDDLE